MSYTVNYRQKYKDRDGYEYYVKKYTDIETLLPLFVGWELENDKTIYSVIFDIDSPSGVSMKYDCPTYTTEAIIMNDKWLTDDYKTRMKHEYDELCIRIDKLYDILDKNERGTLTFELSCPVFLLAQQLRVMKDYKQILEFRNTIEKAW